MPAKIPIGARFFRELTAGETWAVHPAGGIIVCHPERKPLWCRMENGAFVQDWLEPAASAAENHAADVKRAVEIWAFRDLPKP